MSTIESMNVKSLLGYKLKKTQHALRLRMDEILRDLNLTTPQYAVLAQLELEDRLSNAELARRSFITAQTMHGIVSNLENQGLIARKKSPSHGRVLCTTLTHKGISIIQKAHHLIRNVENKMTASLTLEQKNSLEQLLSRCLESLEAL